MYNRKSRHRSTGFVAGDKNRQKTRSPKLGGGGVAEETRPTVPTSEFTAILCETKRDTDATVVERICSVCSPMVEELEDGAVVIGAGRRKLNLAWGEGIQLAFVCIHNEAATGATACARVNRRSALRLSESGAAQLYLSLAIDTTASLS